MPEHPHPFSIPPASCCIHIHLLSALIPPLDVCFLSLIGSSPIAGRFISLSFSLVILGLHTGLLHAQLPAPSLTAYEICSQLMNLSSLENLMLHSGWRFSVRVYVVNHKRHSFKGCCLAAIFVRIMEFLSAAVGLEVYHFAVLDTAKQWTHHVVLFWFYAMVRICTLKFVYVFKININTRYNRLGKWRIFWFQKDHTD